MGEMTRNARRPRLLLAGIGLTVGLGVANAPAAVAEGHDVDQSSPAHGGLCAAHSGAAEGIGIPSANDATNQDGEFSAAGASMLTVRSCRVTRIVAFGTYADGAMPADSVDVTIFKNAHGLPGALVREQDNLAYVDKSGTGDLSISIDPVKLNGAYFVSVVANMSLESGGEWDWQLTSKRPGHDVWENPDDVLGTGCTTFMDLGTCTGHPGSFMIRLVE